MQNVDFKTKILDSGLGERLVGWQKRIERDLEALSVRFGAVEDKLAEACRYALMGGGKRFRPAIVHMVAAGLNKGRDVSEAALAVELFHSASLVADDLPCMDNDAMRRGRPSLHRAFGEGVALLASYALISEGYAALGRNALKKGCEAVLGSALECAARNTGALGATGGQYIDLYPPGDTLEVVLEVLRLKTVTLFEVAFVFGWLFGGGDPERMDGVKRAAAHFGMAFQIADDIDDFDQDEKRGSAMNLAVLLGKEKAKAWLENEIEGFKSTLKILGLERSELAPIIQLVANVGV